jgi:hypothetical protein
MASPGAWADRTASTALTKTLSSYLAVILGVEPTVVCFFYPVLTLICR